MSELNQLLAIEQDQLATKRENRELDYDRFLAEMGERATGPWLEAMPDGSPQTSVAGQSDKSTNNRAETLVTDLVEALSRRYRWLRGRRPTVAAIIGATCAVVPAGVLLGQALLPQQWFHQNRLAIPLLTAILVLVSGLCGWMYYIYMRRQERLAGEDLRRLYRRVQSYQCELYEDMRRSALLSGLHHQVRRLLDRLQEWQKFLADVAELLEADAESVDQDLFDGAMGRRDVLFANRHVLRPHDYNLRRFEQDISTKRSNESIAGHTANGMAEWHRSLATMQPYLRTALKGVNLLETSPDELRHSVREFALTVVKPYLTGDMVSTGAALEAMPAFESAGIFDRLVHQAAILYQPATPATRSGLFVAAREELRRSIMKEDQASGSVLLHIDDEEWLGLLRLQPGGAIPAFWPAGWDTHTNIPASPSWLPATQDLITS
jgi:hypothetical protein